MQNDSPNGVWVSKEEYERLQNPQNVSTASSQPVVFIADTNTQTTGKSSLGGKEIVLIMLAIGSILFPPLLLVVAVLAIVTLVQSRRKSSAHKTALTVLLVVLLVPLIPILFLIAMIILWQVNCWFDPSACRSA